MDYIGKNTLNILIFHFISFKLVSLGIIMANGEPFERLAEFPVLTLHNNFMWILYTIIGVAMPLLIGKVMKKCEHIFNKKEKA